MKQILTDSEVVGKGAKHRDNIKAINDNFDELAGSVGGTISVIWEDIEDKPTSFTPTAHVHPAANTTVAGFMSTADKTKLDGVATGAQVNAVTSVAGKTGAVVLAKADVGLGNVDNTTDAAKPVSTATQTALNAKAANAVATQSVAGLMSGADKTKLDSVATSANFYTLPAATKSVMGGLVQANNVVDAGEENILETLNGLLYSLRAAGHIA